MQFSSIACYHQSCRPPRIASSTTSASSIARCVLPYRARARALRRWHPCCIHVLTSSSQLAKYPALSNLEKSTSIPKAYAFIGLVTLYFFLIVFNLGGQLLTNLAGFALPGYYSMEALFTASKTDDTQWLTVRPPHPPRKLG